MRIGVVAPLYIEARLARPLAAPGWNVRRSGVGARRAVATARELITAGAERLLVWGTAGGLDPALVPGTLLLPQRVADLTGGVHRVDATWHGQLANALVGAGPLETGTLATTADPAATPADKRTLAERTGAVAVDMEAADVLAAAAGAGVPCAVVRAVVDPVDQALPRVVLDAVGDRFLALEIALRLMLRPQDIVAVRRLDRAFRPARASLRRAAQALAVMKLV